MKFKEQKDGTFTLTGVPHEVLSALTHIAGDLGSGNAVLRYDKRMFDPWARPTKETRKALVKFSDETHPATFWGDWDDRFDVLERPKFARRKDR